MKSIRNWALVTLGVVLFCSAGAWADSITMTPKPVSGTISGSPGATIGWGFTLTNITNLPGNGPSYFVVPQNSVFCVGPVSTNCTVAQGTYTDIISSSVLEVAPGDTTQQDFNALTPTGWGSFQLNSNVAVGTTINGTLVLFYGLYDKSLNNFGVQVGDMKEFDVAAAINVVPSTAPVPEPATVFLFGAGIVALRRVSKRNSV